MAQGLHLPLHWSTIIFKHVYWYMQQISGERLQDHWSSGFFFLPDLGRLFYRACQVLSLSCVGTNSNVFVHEFNSLIHSLVCIACTRETGVYFTRATGVHHFHILFEITCTAIIDYITTFQLVFFFFLTYTPVFLRYVSHILDVFL